jgi:hypothetical protein
MPISLMHIKWEAHKGAERWHHGRHGFSPEGAGDTKPVDQKGLRVRVVSRKRRPVVALGAALVLVLQMLAGAAFGADPVRVDVFGNALCATVDLPTPSPLHDGHTKTPVGCCTAGCSMFAAVLAAPDDGHLLQWTPSGETVPGRGYARPTSARHYEPGNPRAPPLMA